MCVCVCVQIKWWNMIKWIVQDHRPYDTQGDCFDVNRDFGFISSDITQNSLTYYLRYL